MKGDETRDRRQEAEAWLWVADADRAAVLICLAANPPLYGIAAFHFQQAIEKLLKGFLMLAGARFRRTHDLDELADAAIASFADLAGTVDAARSWTVWGVAYRYPSPEEQSEPEPDEASLRAALASIDALADRLRATITAG